MSAIISHYKQALRDLPIVLSDTLTQTSIKNQMAMFFITN
jgi:hypothetical protein